MKEWEDILPCPLFVRIDHSLLVNLAAITKVIARDRNETLVFFEGLADPIAIGRPAAPRLKKALLHFAPDRAGGGSRPSCVNYAVYGKYLAPFGQSASILPAAWTF